MRRQQHELVGHVGQLRELGAAFGALGQMLQRTAAVLAIGDAEGELRQDLADLLAAPLHQSSTSSSERSFSMAVRIRVLIVPSGTSSRSLISRAVRPRYAACTSALF